LGSKYDDSKTSVALFHYTTLYGEAMYKNTCFFIHFLTAPHQLSPPPSVSCTAIGQVKCCRSTMPPKKKEVEEKQVLIGRMGTNLKCGIVGKYMFRIRTVRKTRIRLI
jgi:hypothetical protein